jgi:hypothetical protein
VSVLAGFVLTVLLGGCGGPSGNDVASKSPMAILAASKAAAASATSVHVVSETSQGPLSFTADLELASGGGRGRVSVIGLAFEVIRIGETAYLKGSTAFYRHLDAVTADVAAKAPHGTWLKAPVSSPQLARLAAFTDLNGELDRLLGSAGTFTKGITTTVDGQSVIELKEASRLFSGSLFIATTGKPYPIQLIKRGKEKGQTTFSDWNRPVSLSAPANAIAIK